MRIDEADAIYLRTLAEAESIFVKNMAGEEKRHAKMLREISDYRDRTKSIATDVYKSVNWELPPIKPARIKGRK